MSGGRAHEFAEMEDEAAADYERSLVLGLADQAKVYAIIYRYGYWPRARYCFEQTAGVDIPWAYYSLGILNCDEYRFWDAVVAFTHYINLIDEDRYTER